MILRKKVRGGISPLALLEYLGNPVVHEFIQSLAGGTAIQSIAMKDLNEVAIPIPDDATIAAIAAKFAERQAVFDRIAELGRKVVSLRGSTWPNPELEGETPDATE
ncbi:hypothetical protein NHN26_15960 [Rhodovulum tesquicola]|uniref:restriction endonuclease subunit S n=1 Tax=Rhodovulum tesquicola TaxID=540254 RepID=UPI002096FED8|nr:hypothetical protein [Rhodovulum tesquicola]MCO8146707.1 hypothetical protein [Rhodovulum tesquicola]